MNRFFHFFAIICALSLLASLVAGHFSTSLDLAPSHHLLLGLTAGLLTVSLHCLVFGIFTGAGKDTRELVQDLKLDPQYVGSTKAFRRIAFPPALYGIFLVVLTTTFGGALSASGGTTLRWAHFLLAWTTFLYNLKAFWLEARCVRENAAILARVNQEASRALITHPEEGKAIPEVAGMLSAATETLEWEAHVYALGKFLTFLGWNTWLPFIYLRFIMGYLTMPVWPFLTLSLACLGGGYYLRWRYQAYRPSVA